MTAEIPSLDLNFIRGSAPRLPSPLLGPDGYTRLIAAAWESQTPEDQQRYLNDPRNRPVPAWFLLNDEAKD